ncbi:MAG TPA: META domain-containing protein [Anaerolineae bacterium]
MSYHNFLLPDVPQTRRLLATALLCLLLVFAMLGCTSSMGSANEDMPPGDTGLVGPQWRLVSITTPERTIELGQADGTATIRFSGEADEQSENANSMSGDTGCNTFEGAYNVGEGQSLAVIYLSATEIFCGDRAFEIEQAYLAALWSVGSYEITGDTLRLLSKDKTSTLTFRKSTG